MGHRLKNFHGNTFNEEDPLGVLEAQQEELRKLNEVSPIQYFIEHEAKKKDEARKFRIEPITQVELANDYFDIHAKLIGMVVIFKKGRHFIKGRIDKVMSGFLKILERGTKIEYYPNFDEVLSLKRNYN